MKEEKQLHEVTLAKVLAVFLSTHVMHTETGVQYLVVHAVDPIGPQQVDGLANEIRASTVEHPETQI